MARTLQHRIRRNRQQKAVLNALLDGASLAHALRDGKASWFDFTHKWSLAGELLRDALASEAVEKVRQGDHALETLLTVRDPNLTFSPPRGALRVQQAQSAAADAWGRQAVRDAKAEIRLREKQLRDVALGRAPSIGNSGSNYKPPPP